MKDFFRYLIRPDFWFSLYPVNLRWDQRLNELLENHVPTEIRDYTCQLGPVTVWIANYPCAYGYPLFKPTSGSIIPYYTLLPKRRTREKLKRAVEEAMVRGLGA